jgi:hypothetical protein
MISKTEPTSTRDGVFSTGATNPTQKITKNFSRRMIFFRASMSWKKLILLAAGLGCVQLHGAINDGATNFETAPLKPGSIQWDENQRVVKERQELYRKRVSIPDAAGDNVPRASDANSMSNQKTLMAQAEPPPDAADTFQKILFFTAMLVFVQSVVACHGPGTDFSGKSPRGGGILRRISHDVPGRPVRTAAH